MIDEFLERDIDGTLSNNSSSVRAASNNWVCGDFFPASRFIFDSQNLVNNFAIHRKMVLVNAIDIDDIRPISYVRLSKFSSTHSSNSSNNLYAVVSSYYDKIEQQLIKLSSVENGADGVEPGAVSSALTIIDHLKKNNLAPPALSWHGGDAVVMLWALGDTTYAMTVTDGEVGYVVRRNRKAIRIADSIQLDAFTLSDLR